MAKASTETKSPLGTGKGQYCTSVIVALLALTGAYVYFDRTSTLNRFGAAVTETLCDMLPAPNPVKPTPPTPATSNPKKESEFNPKLPGGKSYNAKGTIL